MGANNDEETYLARIFEMSLGHVMPNSYLGTGAYYPKALMTNSYRQDVNLWPVDATTWLSQIKVKMNWQDRDADSLFNYKTRAVYFPTLFVIQAVIMKLIGPLLNLPVVSIYYLLRLSYLLIYTLLVYLALKIIPFGKWILGVVAIAPTSLMTSTSISPDPIVFGVCFLFFAWIIFLLAKTDQPLSTKKLIITCLLILAVCTLKPNTIFLLLLLFALPYKGFLKKKDVIFLVTASILGVVLSLGWTYLASKIVVGQLNLAGDSTLQVWALLKSPLNFFKVLGKTFAVNSKTYLFQLIGTSGYSYWRFPIFLYFLYPISIAVAFFLEEKKNFLTVSQKVVFVLTLLVNIFAIFALFFVANTPNGSITIVGVSGRYFTLLLPVLFLPFVINKPIKAGKPIFYGLAGLTGITVVVTLFLAYHVVCGGFWVNGQTCKLPYYKNWGPETFIPIKLTKGTELTQNIIVDCQTVSQIEILPLENGVSGVAAATLNIRTGSGELLSTSSFSPQGVEVNQWYTIDIPKIVGMKGTAISIEILPAEDEDLSLFALGTFPTNEYTKGELFIKDGKTGKSTSADNDLIFRYTCDKP
jgi:uncharacterized membrane protein